MSLGVDRRAELKARFQELDSNGDGHLSSSEIGQACLALGMRVPPEIVTQLIQDADSNYNGLLQFDDFVLLINRYSPTDGTVWGALIAPRPTSAIAAALSPDQITVWT